MAFPMAVARTQAVTAPRATVAEARRDRSRRRAARPGVLDGVCGRQIKPAVGR